MMHRIQLYSVVLLFLGLGLVSCQQDQGDNTKGITVARNDTSIVALNAFIDIKYAQGFRVEEFEHYTRLTVVNPWNRSADLGTYVLVQKSTDQAIEIQEGEMLIELPLSRIAIMSASNIGYFDLLEKLDLIKAMADENRVYNKQLRQNIELGSIQVLGNSEAINLEKLMVSGCDIFLQTAYETGVGKDESMKKAGVKIVYNIDWMEKTPLARAEWIKFFGLLTNNVEKANAIFQQIEENYIQLKEFADTLSYKPDVLVGTLYKDVWYMPGGNSYKAHLMADAGTNYTWASDTSQGSLALSFETVVAKQLNAPVWIEAPFKTKLALINSDERYGYFDAFKIGAMYHNLKRSNASGGNDYWEMGLCRPDEILSDLIRIFHPEEMPEGELKYYQRVN